MDLNQVINRKNTNSKKYDFAKENGMPEGLIPFWIADMDFPVAPAITEALMERVKHGIYGYSDTKESYFDAVSQWFTKQFHWTPKSEWLVKTPGIVPAINIGIQALTKEGDAVLVNRPVYYPFLEGINNNKRRLINSPLIKKDNHYEINFADMEQKIIDNDVKLAIICTPHNPVGRIWTRDELQTYLDICVKHNVKIIADEIHADFNLPGYHHTTFGSLGEKAENNAIICTAPSKTFNIAGLQISNIWIANKEIREKFLAIESTFGYCEVNIMGIIACEAAYRHGEEWLIKVKEYISDNRNYTEAFLEKYLPKMKLTKAEGLYLLWIDCNAYGLSPKALEQKIVNEAHLWMDMGDMFGEEGNGYFRMNIACPRVTLEQGLKQLYEAFKE